MAIKKHLTEEQIRQIHDAAIRAGLASSRSALLGGIDPSFVMSLPNAQTPGAQLLIDLAELNQTPTLLDGTTPLLDWLGNASLLAGPRHEADVFRVALATIKPPSAVDPLVGRPQTTSGHGALGSATPPLVELVGHRPPRAPRGLGFAPGRLKCFVGYAPQDERFARDLLKHLSTLERSGALSVCHSGGGLAGDALSHSLALVGEADVVLFMVSADLFIDETAETWIDQALDRAGNGVRVVPVLTRPVDFLSTRLGAYRALPSSGEPITAFKIPDEAYADIARAIRAVVTERTRGTEHKAPPAAEPAHELSAPSGIVDLTAVFSSGTTSERTFVAPVEMEALAAAVHRGRRGLVVQGPSGSGKSTAVRKLIPDLRSWLSCIKKGDLLTLGKILDGAPLSGHLVIDEFHELPAELRHDVANLIKITCDEPAGGAKITVIGVNNSGEMLFQGNTNLAGRVDFIEMRQRQPERKIQELVQKGERLANVRFMNRDALVVAARGSFILAQQLCSKALSRVVATSRSVQDVDVDVDELAQRVAADLGSFRSPIVDFVRLSEAHLVTLWMLSRTSDDEISLQEVGEEFPELDASLAEIVARRAEGGGPLRQYLHIDRRGRVVCWDVQFMFYLARLKDRDWMNIAQDASRSIYFDEGFLRVARVPPRGGAPDRSILDLDVDELWTRPEAVELLSVLCAAYDTLERVKWIASLAGVDMHDVIQMGSIRTVWVDLLRAAIRAGELRRLFVVIQSDSAVARYHHKIRRLIS